jgi:hypothetical protein
MLVAYVVPGEVVVSSFSVVIASVVAIAIALSRTRERLAKLEEWARLHERNDPPA